MLNCGKIKCGKICYNYKFILLSRRTNMKKSIVFLTLCIAVILTFSNVSFAASKVVESPIIKTFVSGKQVKFNSVPITVNGEILITADELLVKLGVPNDSKHIIVDKNKKSLTIDNGKIKIKMITNSNKATVDKSSKTLNSAPIIYKNKFYIPVKSATQLLGMKFAWDDIEKSVYIQTVNYYNKVKAILDKAITTTKEVDKYIVDFSGASSLDKVTSVNKVDKNKMIMVSKAETVGHRPEPSNIDYYLVNNTWYQYYPLTEEERELIPDEEEWEKKFPSKTECQGWILQYDVSKFVISDILYCGLTIEDNLKDNTIKLKGNVYLHEDNVLINAIDYKVEPINTYSEICISKSNYLITKINLTYSEYQKKASKNKKLYSSSESYTYKDFNGDFSSDFDDNTLDEIKIALKETKIYLNEKDAEEAKINDLTLSVDKIFIDGAYKHPYKIKTTEGIMFIVIKNENDFNTFNELSENSKKVFINEIIQNNYGDYLGCETVLGITIYNSKGYTFMETSHEADFEKLTLNEFQSPSKFTIVVQDKKKNTFKDYNGE